MVFTRKDGIFMGYVSFREGIWNHHPAISPLSWWLIDFFHLRRKAPEKNILDAISASNGKYVKHVS